MTDLDFVRVERSDGIATLTVHRPEKLNALSAAVIRELGSAFGELAADDRVAGILVTGSGDRAFVAGADISELAALTPEEALALSRRGQALFGSIEASPKPVVAAIGGVALGGGCELALACHLRVASEDALLGLPEVGLGLIPAYGGTVRLSRLIGLGRALEMILGGEPIGAETARAIGLVNAVVPRAELLEHARARLEGILRNAPIALRMALESVHHAQRAPEAEALRHESALFALLVSTEDMREGTRAFLEKRRPGFRGR